MCTVIATFFISPEIILIIILIIKLKEQELNKNAAIPMGLLTILWVVER